MAHAARMAEVRNEYTTFVKKTGKTRVEGPGCTMEDDKILKILRAGMDWIQYCSVTFPGRP